MPEVESQAAATLRKRFRYFLADQAESKKPRARVINRLTDLGWDACIFGGTLRDIALRGSYTQTRDIDIVVAGVTSDQIEREMKPWVSHRNRFGGLQLDVEGTLFDMWPLQETWAIKNWTMSNGPTLFSDFNVLPSTTFLTVESIAVSLKPEASIGRMVYHKGFFESIAHRTIEINHAYNPFPALCVARAILTASRLNFLVGPNLAHFLDRQLHELDHSEIVRAQVAHYGYAPVCERWLTTIAEKIRNALVKNPLAAIDLGIDRQLEWSWANPDPIERFINEYMTYL